MQAWVGLGGNLPGTRAALDAAALSLSRLPTVSGLSASGLYQTPPWGDEDQPDFLNAVLRLETGMPAENLLRALLQLEAELGRKRNQHQARRWGPRLIDLDLLAYGDLRYHSNELELPHPRMHLRAFVLVPLLELEPDFEISGRGSARECLGGLPENDVRSVRPLGPWRPYPEI